MSNGSFNNYVSNTATTTTSTSSDEIEFYPRRKRAPYLDDISDFGLQTRTTLLRYHTDGTAEDHLSNIDDNLALPPPGSPTKLSSAAGINEGRMQRKSSFARVFSTLRMSIAENECGDANNNNGNTNYDIGRNSSTDGVGLMTSMTVGGGQGGHLVVGDTSAGPDEGGGGAAAVGSSARQHYHFDESSSESNLNSILPTRFRRGSSADFMNLSRAGGGGGRDRLLSTTSNTTAGKIPRWALYDPATIVMKDGVPISMGTLLHHYALLNNNNQSRQQLSQQQPYLLAPTWRLKERMKTVGVVLVLALNIGTDPPDLNKPTPCAKLQCWLDPTSISRAKAKERIGERLEQQYAKWQQRSKLKYRRALDPTVDTVRELCYRMRETAKNERVLLHYNGHGVPKPTSNGEIWLFDKHHTNYIPLSVTDLRRWIGKPTILVLDCSGAGVLMPFLTSTLNSGVSGDAGQGGWNFSSSSSTHGPLGVGPATAAVGSSGVPMYQNQSSSGMDNSDPGESASGADYLKAIRDTIVLCPTSKGEWLPLNPEFPADIFTSCLTTPIPMALRWFVHENPLSTKGLNPQTIADAIPGTLADRKTPLGELNWIFTAITDTIAWNVLPSPLFQRLFRQDLLVASEYSLCSLPN